MVEPHYGDDEMVRTREKPAGGLHRSAPRIIGARRLLVRRAIGSVRSGHGADSPCGVVSLPGDGRHLRGVRIRGAVERPVHGDSRNRPAMPGGGQHRRGSRGRGCGSDRRGRRLGRGAESSRWAEPAAPCPIQAPGPGGCHPTQGAFHDLAAAIRQDRWLTSAARAPVNPSKTPNSDVGMSRMQQPVGCATRRSRIGERTEGRRGWRSPRGCLTRANAGAWDPLVRPLGRRRTSAPRQS